jgi:hypothetical protein
MGGAPGGMPQAASGDASTANTKKRSLVFMTPDLFGCAVETTSTIVARTW